MDKILSCIGRKGDSSVDPTFLHGSLKIRIERAADLPDTDNVCFNLSRGDVTDPYVSGMLCDATLFKTRYVNNETDPVWNETFTLLVCHLAKDLVINVKDKDHVGGQQVGKARISCEDIVTGEPIEGWYELTRKGRSCGRIYLSLQYLSKDDPTVDDTGFEVPEAYFPLRENNRLILYQDADTPPLPQLRGVHFPDGSPYVPTRAWRDLYDALNSAQKFIYITGWSVSTDIQLLRGEEDPDGKSNVGKLLARKAEEGVKVLLMIWDEKLSTDTMDGLMGTHDEETRRYFEQTLVECVLVGRTKAGGYLADQFVSTCYSHHQKTVVCDEEDPANSDRRRVVAFLGGLDVTTGRYDTPEFPLYKTIGNLHAGDFYSNCVAGVSEQVGPREPWHDCHAKVEGPAALDIKKNFDERWSKQAEDKVTLLYVLDEDFETEVGAVVPDNEAGTWNLQLFRSITSDSCVFDTASQGILHSKGGRLVENTIMRCLVHKIRKARNFIYLENQYFLGSAFAWEGERSTLTNHVVPSEIATKIAEKIGVGESFKVYVLVPMFPEGIPTTDTIQEILHWQCRTMEAMYRRISKAIEMAAADTHPTDYLSFYCLGKRESLEEVPADELEEPLPDSDPAVVRSTLRHCIYVHSKMTIFDDEYILIGSANVNQRSLGGNRDSEIAIGGYQPGQTIGEQQDGQPRGDVHTYRMALWACHFGAPYEEFLHPGSDECLAKVREVSKANWELYVSDEPQHSDVHILPYPISVDQDGCVTALDPPWDCFPDTCAKVLGAPSGYLPAKLTT